MSHFTVLVIGDVDEQLAAFDEGLEVDEYQRELVSEEEKKSFVESYTKERDDHLKISKEEAEENAKLSFEELYAIKGEDWNSNTWRINADGDWAEFTTYNPKSKWDWYIKGGRWSGDYFRLKHGTIGRGMGEAGVFGNPVGIDVVRFGDIDWEAMRAEGEESAKDYWEKLEAAFGGTLPVDEIKWKDMWKEDSEYFKLSRDEKIKVHNAQPSQIRVAAVRKLAPELFGWMFDLDEYACGKEAYIKRGGEAALTTAAVVVNGEWYEKGEMGWFGMCHNEKATEDWSNEMEALLVGVDADELATLVDCHI